MFRAPVKKTADDTMIVRTNVKYSEASASDKFCIYNFVNLKSTSTSE